MVQPPFGEPGVCPMIVLISYTTNQFLIGGFFSTASFRLRRTHRGLSEFRQSRAEYGVALEDYFRAFTLDIRPWRGG
jgi:hypothetical protein